MYAEFELIDRIAARFSSAEGVTVGIGDDGAVIDPGRFDLVTTDTMVEGVHFRRDWSSAEDIGWKLMATNLSDIAAMGGGPGVAFLNLTLPHDEQASFVDGLLEGLALAIEALVPPSFTVSIAGGDVTSTFGPAVLTLTLMGESSPAGPVLRQGAVPGDRIVLFGHTDHLAVEHRRELRLAKCRMRICAELPSGKGGTSNAKTNTHQSIDDVLVRRVQRTRAPMKDNDLLILVSAPDVRLNC